VNVVFLLAASQHEQNQTRQHRQSDRQFCVDEHLLVEIAPKMQSSGMKLMKSRFDSAPNTPVSQPNIGGNLMSKMLLKLQTIWL